MARAIRGIRGLIGGLVTAGVGTFFAGMGATGVHTYITNPKPLELDCADFTPAKVERAWVRLTNCIVPLDEAVGMYETKNGKQRITDLYAPVFSTKEYGDGSNTDNLKTSLAFRTSRHQEVELWSRYDQLLSNDSDQRDSQIDNFLSTNNADFFRTGPIEGVVRLGFAKLDNDDSEVKRNQPKFREDFLVLDVDEKPSLPFSLAKLGFGLAFLGAAAFRGVRFFSARS